MVGPVAAPGFLLGEVLVEVETVPDVVPQEGPHTHREVVVAVNHGMVAQHSVDSLPGLLGPLRSSSWRGNKLGAAATQPEEDQTECDARRHLQTETDRIISKLAIIYLISRLLERMQMIMFNVLDTFLSPLTYMLMLHNTNTYVKCTFVFALVQVNFCLLS